MKKTSTYARKRKLAKPSDGLEPMRLLNIARPYSPGEMIQEHVITKAAYIRLRDGSGTEEDFDRVSMILNVGLLRAEQIDQLLVETMIRGQQAADKMAMEHKVERDWLNGEVERLKTAAKYAEHIDATPANQRETMLHDLITERNELRQQLAAAQALIEAIRKQSPVAWKLETRNYGLGEEVWDTVEFRSDKWDEDCEPLFAAPVIAPDVLKDAQRYRWLREYLPSTDLSVDDDLVAALNPQEIDAAIDAAMGSAA